MAYVGADNKLQDPNQQAQGQGQAQQQDPNQQAPQANVANAGASGDTITGGASGQPGAQSPSMSSGQQAGTGGQGGWTNIQSYMQANQGDTGSAKNLQDKAGGQFDTEKQNLDTQAGQVKQQGQAQADSIKQAQSGAAQMVSDAAKNYSYSGQQGDPYNQNVGKLKSAINGQYSGPSDFQYSFGADTQKAGDALGNDGAFNNYLGDIYQQRAGGQLSQGGKSLQTQLDSGNQALADTRQNLLKQYSGLGDYRNQTVTDTTKALGDDASQYRNNQDSLKNYLSGEADKSNQNVANAEAAARTGYQNSNASGEGMGDKLGEVVDYKNRYMSGNMGWDDLKNRMKDWSNETWEQSQDPNFHASDPLNAQLAQHYSQPINDFYSQQDAKYANTGDEDKRKWNAIEDVLGNKDRKSEGFKVRG